MLVFLFKHNTCESKSIHEIAVSEINTICVVSLRWFFDVLPLEIKSGSNRVFFELVTASSIHAYGMHGCVESDYV